MIISRIRLSNSPSAGSLFRLLGDRLGTYESHRLVWALFADNPDKPRDFLYRLDWKSGRPEIITVSAEPPQDHHNLFEIESKPYDPALRPGDRLAFMVRVNPVWRKEVDGRRRKVDVVMDGVHARRAAGETKSDRLEVARAVLPGWLDRQGERDGFRLAPEALLVETYDRVEFVSSTRRRVTLAGCDLRGELTVTEPDAFRRMLFGGLGASKAFGYGLVLVRRPLGA